MNQTDIKQATDELAKLKPGTYQTADYPNIKSSQVRLNLAQKHRLAVCFI